MSIRHYGDLETAADGTRMVVRVLGLRVGTSDGWFHWNGWAVVAPNFEPDEDALEKIFADLVIAPDLEGKAQTKLGLVADFYTGSIALIEMPKDKGDTTTDPHVLAEAQVSGLNAGPTRS